MTQHAVHQYDVAELLIAVGLLLPVSLVLAGSPSMVNVPLDSDGIQRAVVETDSYTFTPQHLVVRAGQPVELTFKSVTMFVPHTAIIDDPQSGLHIREEIPSGQSRSITFTPMVQGVFAIYCDKKLPFLKSHREKGQEGVLEVR
jgi:plastocyanin